MHEMNPTIGSVSELLAIFSCTESDGLLQGLNTLRKQWRLKDVEGYEKITDSLAAYAPILRYAQSEPEMSHVFKLLSASYANATSETSLAFVSVLTSILEILRRSAARGIACKVGRLIVRDHVKFFYRLLASGHNIIVAPTLNLMTAVASIDPSLNESFFGAFDFSFKTLPRLAMMRKKNLGDFEHHDIRTAYIHFILCFLKYGSHQTKLALSKMQNLISPLFNGLFEDPFDLVFLIFETVWNHLVLNEKKSKALTIAFFYSSTLTKIAKLYDSSNAEIVKLADNFLRKLCTNDESGLCYRISADVDVSRSKIPLRNKIILEFVMSLAPLESLQKQNLCLDLLQACPDIFPHYWNRAGFVFDPEPSVRYVNLVSYAVKAFDAVNVQSSLDLTLEDVYFSKAFNSSGATFTRGLGHSNRLVVYSSSLLLATLLKRTRKMISKFEQSLVLLEGNAEELLFKRNQWLIELMRQLPGYKSIQGLALSHLSGNSDKDGLILVNELEILESYRQCFSHLTELPNPEFIPPARTLPLFAQFKFFSFLSRNISNLSLDLFDSLYNFIEAVGDCYESRNMLVNHCKTMLLHNGICGRHDEECYYWEKLMLELPFKECISTWIALKDTISKIFVRKFARDFNGYSPVLEDLGKKFIEDYSLFKLALSSSNLIPIEVSSFKPQSKDQLNIEQPSTMEQASPELVGNSFSSLTDEIFAHIKPDVVVRHLLKIDFKEWCPVSKKLDKEGVSRLLLIDFEPTAWLQFLANLLVSNMDKVECWNGDLRIILESGAACFALYGLASGTNNFRKASHFVMELFFRHLENATFRERREITLLFGCLRNSLSDFSRIPLVICAFMGEAVQVLLRPAHFMYAILMEFLLASHSLDLKRIPLLSKCIFGTMDEHSGKRQCWLLRILTAGLEGPNDFCQLYLPNHVLDVVLELLQSPTVDIQVEQACRRFMVALLKMDGGSLVSRLKEEHGLVAWLCVLPKQKAMIKNELIAFL